MQGQRPEQTGADVAAMWRADTDAGWVELKACVTSLMSQTPWQGGGGGADGITDDVWLRLTSPHEALDALQALAYHFLASSICKHAAGQVCAALSLRQLLPLHPLH